MDPEPFATPDFIGQDPTYGHGAFPVSTQNGLAWFYVVVVLLNLGFAFYQFHKKNRTQAAIWGIVAAVFLIHAFAYFAHAGWVLSQGIRNGVDWFIGPVTYFVGATLVYIIVLYFRRFLTQ